ncbi:MAG: hypothetical protein A2070_10770 [Bdellovibrionales bacterium GWC1_52_8]|nr:MAG: hypothetical protein A2Z97_16345 [Bdellovibrionales bacterium GWB1_52_6]OFZ03846.1 MAG: hypothetical protein A2X97_15720 [Bdellovibrionales bacterium GWA1_52_35]OFZ38667.1 MAG: hypothetical protein A2070_10770 [Bdellovibrionales bacterium GWC1_52_8]HCM39719.1 cation:proton antiporter [Bdellovibrionales bacterium]
MEAVLAIVMGILFASAIFLMLRPSLIRFALGLILLTNASNLFIFAAGRLTLAVPPLIPPGEQMIAGNFANPVSEALILTAIVIGFGLLSFTLAYIYRAHKAHEEPPT